MTEITDEMAQVCYDYSLKIFRGKIDRGDGITEICCDTYMDYSTAKRYVGSLIKIMRGEKYSAMLKSDFYLMFFDYIYRDFGKEGLDKAFVAVREHVRDYKRPLYKVQEILTEVEKKYDLK